MFPANRCVLHQVADAVYITAGPRSYVFEFPNVDKVSGRIPSLVAFRNVVFFILGELQWFYAILCGVIAGTIHLIDHTGDTGSSE